jgi:ElaB/YqjD/DUF883 family membrane-anchored ribosome-binding protein
MHGDRDNSRIAFYYLLAEKFGKLASLHHWMVSVLKVVHSGRERWCSRVQQGGKQMNSTSSSGPVSRSASDPKSAGVSTDSVSARVESANDLSDDVNKLRRDMAGLKDTFSRFMSQTSGEAAKAVRNVSQTVASQVSSATGGVADAGSELASAAKEHAKTFASELEAMARRNPLGTIAGALVIGVVIGMMSRGRS